MVTKKQELSRDEMIQSFDRLPDDATVVEFIDHLADILGIAESRSGNPAKEAASDSSLPDRMRKQQLMESLGRLQKEATVDDVAYRLYVILKVEKGMAASRAGHKVTQEEARERLKRWLQ